MPRQDHLDVPLKDMEKAAKRLLAGERAETIAKELKVSRATVFNYAVRYRKTVLERERRAGLSPAAVDRVDKLDLIATIRALKADNRHLKERLVAMALGTDPVPRAVRAYSEVAHARSQASASPKKLLDGLLDVELN